MGALPRPFVPEGPGRALVDELHELHHRAGWPSLREMAKEIGCSHTTVSTVFSDARVSRWGLLELVVETLGGDTERFQQLWLAATAVAAPASGEPMRRAIPRELPADVAGFAGRDAALAHLDELLAASGQVAPAVMIAVVSGTAGVGKTALAVRWAHRVADRFPDGQLYLNLRGYGPDKPVAPSEALAVLLRSLGMQGSDLPHDTAERAAAYRTLLADRRVIVLLDNADSVEQVRDLLPGGPACFVLVTSRELLPGLVARHGAVRISLDLLSIDEATALLRRLIGERVDDESQDATTLARRCARLPLALRIAAELAAEQPDTPLGALVAELGDESHRLDLFGAGGDEDTALRTVFSWSRGHLSTGAATMFQLLGLHPGPDIDRDATAALAGLAPAEATRLLGELVRANLIEHRGPRRYSLHDLLRAYAAEQAAACEQTARKAAWQRLADHYIALAEGADPTQLDADLANLLAIAAAAANESPEYTQRISSALASYLDATAHYQQGLSLHLLAVDAARRRSDRPGEAMALNQAGEAYTRISRYPEAREHHRLALGIFEQLADRRGQAAALQGIATVFVRVGENLQAVESIERALRLHRGIGDRAGEARDCHTLGLALLQLGRFDAAIEHYDRAIALHRERGDRRGEGRAFNNLGIICLRLGRYDEALANYNRCLAFAREQGNRTGVGVALANIGDVAERLGRYDDAIARYREALAICADIGYRIGHSDAVRGLGVVYSRLGRHEDAIGSLQRAVDVTSEIGEADVGTAALNDLGDALRAAGHADASATRHRQALDRSIETGDRYQQARALDGLARLALDTGDLPSATSQWQQALEIFGEIGAPEAASIREALTGAATDS